MKKFTITLALSILAVLLVATPCNAKGKAKHVVLIGLDGWGAYSVPKADIPTIKQLMADGAYTLEKRSALPSSSAINWASMFMGVLNCTGTHNGDLKHPNYLRVYSISMAFSPLSSNYCAMHSPKPKSVACTNGTVSNIWWIHFL